MIHAFAKSMQVVGMIINITLNPRTKKISKQIFFLKKNSNLKTVEVFFQCLFVGVFLFVFSLNNICDTESSRNKKLEKHIHTQL